MLNLLCLPGGLLGPSSRPIPPAGAGPPPFPFMVVGGGIFKEPVLICLYSAETRGPPWLNIEMVLYGCEFEGVDRCKVKAVRYRDPASRWGIECRVEGQRGD